MNHLSNDELNELIDGRLVNSNKERALGHLQECPSCSSAYRQLTIIDRGVRRQPLETTSTMFVENLMRKIVPYAKHERQSLLEHILKYSANFFALVIVVLMVYGIFSIVNHLMPGEHSIAPQVEELSKLSKVQIEITGWWNSVNTQIHQYMVMLAPQGKLPLWVYALWSIFMIVIVEKVAGKRFRHINQFR